MFYEFTISIWNISKKQWFENLDLKPRKTFFQLSRRIERDTRMAVVMQPLDIFWSCVHIPVRYKKKHNRAQFHKFFRCRRKKFCSIYKMNLSQEFYLQFIYYFRKWSWIWQMRKKSGTLQVCGDFVIILVVLYLQ